MKLTPEEKQIRKNLQDQFVESKGCIFDYPVFGVVILVRIDENDPDTEIVIGRGESRKQRELNALHLWGDGEAIIFPQFYGWSEEDVADTILTLLV